MGGGNPRLSMSDAWRDTFSGVVSCQQSDAWYCVSVRDSETSEAVQPC